MPQAGGRKAAEAMTDEMMSQRALIKKTPDADLLGEMIGFAAQRLPSGPAGPGRAADGLARCCGQGSWRSVS